jgi:polyisoprenoid-binding protein YceI
VPKYRVGAGSKLVVKARSPVHDTSTVWSAVSGDVEADAATLATTGATGTFAVDMTAYDAGDFLKNRKLRKDFDLDSHPRATFELVRVRDVVGEGGRFKATAEGVLRWRGKEVPVVVAGEGTLDATRLTARGTFDLDIRTLGLSAPRFLMIKMEDEVSVEVTLSGTVA